VEERQLIVHKLLECSNQLQLGTEGNQSSALCSNWEMLEG